MKATLRDASVGVVVIGVGNDVHTQVVQLISCTTVSFFVFFYYITIALNQVLKDIAESTGNNKGTYVFAEGDKKSIDEAFGQVAMLIQGTLVMEDMQ